MSAWPAAIWIFEKTEPFTGEPLPNVVTVADPRFEAAIGLARLHVHAMMRERGTPGLAIAVEKDGELVWSEGFGYSDRETKAQATPETRYRVASVSKLFTAATLGRLYEEWRIPLAGRWFAEVRETFGY